MGDLSNERMDENNGKDNKKNQHEISHVHLRHNCEEKNECNLLTVRGSYTGTTTLASTHVRSFWRGDGGSQKGLQEVFFDGLRDGHTA